VHQFGLDAEPTFDVYFVGGGRLSRRTDGIRSFGHCGGCPDVVHKVDPNLPLTRIMTMDGLSRTRFTSTFSAALIGIFAALALLLARWGSTGDELHREPTDAGNWSAHGAWRAGRPRARHDPRANAQVDASGVGIGLAALCCGAILASLLFGVGTYDPLTFLAVARVADRVSLAASYIPADERCAWIPLWLCGTNKRFPSKAPASADLDCDFCRIMI